jgi:hypothetical protein
MNEEDKAFGAGILVGIFVGFVACFYIVINTTDPGDYKQGHIDALTGNVKFELVTLADSTRVWRRND